MLTAALLMIVVAAAVGVCGWVDMLGGRLLVGGGSRSRDGGAVWRPGDVAEPGPQC